MYMQCGYRVHVLNIQMTELYSCIYLVLVIYVRSLWGTFVKVLQFGKIKTTTSCFISVLK